MLLTITTTHRPATDLGYLLHKHPGRFQSFDLSFGKAHVFYPEVSDDRCSACLLLEVDPVGIVRGKGSGEGLLSQYVNDRAYVASSFLSVAISQVFRSALQGRCDGRSELATTPMPLSVRLDVLAVRGGEDFLKAVFEPLGYAVESERKPLDERFPDWGESHYHSVTVSKVGTLSEILTHLYVLIPVFDNKKHYFVGDDELEKLLKKGRGWLGAHPLRDEIARRYLKSRASLYREALARLVAEEQPTDAEADRPPIDEPEEVLERPFSLNEQRQGAVLASLRGSGARKVLDLGCGEGKLLRSLLKDRQFEQIVGMDVSIRTLEVASERLKLDRMSENQASRIKLIHGSLMYRDRRLEGFDAAAVVEVVEHLDPPRLASFERVLFEFARPSTIVLTTPNREYNVTWENVGPDKLRHPDHRFEWTRAEFRAWAEGVAGRFGYSVRFLPVGPEDEALGSPTQMGVFARAEVNHGPIG
ncbi:3' terminal RNA ribose 2'-O-methyltransferase Hen1 [Tundrisphaera lichenicola]|uniref:3' terminal RNA ribose 2'-O-methyltransferase Hen1 n=1 Tax=Tundrisphaera lichenicola TaxID=2029860 RepID=UPI003EBE821B